ncbi:MAG TPA: hypothetical protein PKK90_00895 [Anaerolineaceae bacterium]|jgi:hypothetical protein|nr:hypothetical protein [Anaerolineaceae bacterium]HPT23956.1 hypothetical protein [Anaerolineaceae bacterium]
MTNTSLLPFPVPLPAQIYLVVGQHALSEKMLQLIAALSLKQRLTVLDCGNRSNMYAVAKLIRPFTDDPVNVMNHIRLSRAFTCYQVLAMLEAVAANPPGEPLVILDLLATFLDEDVKLKDSQHLLQRSIACLRRLSQAAPVVISIRPTPAITQERAILLEDLRANASVYWEEPLPLPAGYGLQPALFG